MSFKKKIILSIFPFIFVSIISMKAAYAMDTVNGDNYTASSAYNMGRYTEGKSVTAILPAEESSSYFKFTVNTDEKIYVRCSYDKNYSGMTIGLRDAFDSSISRSSRVYDSSSAIPFLAVNCDGEKNSQTFYVKVERGSYDITKPMYFSITLYNRIKTGSGSFSFTGNAVNKGNSSMSRLGIDSSVIKLDLRKNSEIPVGAIVKSVRTSSYQSPSQGNVHHMLMPENAGIWFTSKVSSATSGSYDITQDRGYLVNQIWDFKYNAMATKSSTMNNVKLTFDWIYDLANTNYQTVISRR